MGRPQKDTTPRYLRTHADFTAVAEFEQLLAMGAEDTSWHNDLCPSVEHNGYCVWVSDFDEETGKYVDPIYCVSKLDANGILADEPKIATLAEVIQLLTN